MRKSNLGALAAVAWLTFPVTVLAGNPTTIDVEVGIVGEGTPTIGTITVDEDVDSGSSDFIEAMFELDRDYAYLEDWYNFRWVNVLTDVEIDGVPQTSDSVLGDLPAIDPQPGDGVDSDGGGPDEEFNDSKPFYFTDAEGGTMNLDYSDNRSDSEDDIVLTFQTWLVVESETDPFIAPTAICVLAGFSWTSTISNGEGDEMLTGTTENPTAADITEVDDALANADNEGMDFDDWTATSDCVLSACFPVPTLSEWGVIGLGTALLCAGAVLILKRSASVV